jgi:hypothetical protein
MTRVSQCPTSLRAEHPVYDSNKLEGIWKEAIMTITQIFFGITDEIR